MGLMVMPVGPSPTAIPVAVRTPVVVSNTDTDALFSVGDVGAFAVGADRQAPGAPTPVVVSSQHRVGGGVDD